MPMKRTPFPMPKDISTDNGGTCHYEQIDQKSEPKVEISLVMTKITDEDKELADWAWNAGKHGSAGKVESAPGIGDDAYFIRNTHSPVIKILVRKRAWTFYFSIEMFKNDPVAAMKEVAKKIADQF
jgi:hypothetical protein